MKAISSDEQKQDKPSTYKTLKVYFSEAMITIHMFIVSAPVEDCFLACLKVFSTLNPSNEVT